MSLFDLWLTTIMKPDTVIEYFRDKADYHRYALHYQWLASQGSNMEII